MRCLRPAMRIAPRHGGHDNRICGSGALTSALENQARKTMERPLPHNVGAEKSVLGGILGNNENYYSVVESLKQDDFYLEAHRIIFREMSEIFDASKAVDLITLQNRLERDSLLESAG